ncbi:MAG: DUF4347 domain-containing protein, partial [Planctomycetaceae bacterium]|nr:DUF4347 domain-containing protein [Planctomycetaceae bacterium]
MSAAPAPELIDAGVENGSWDDAELIAAVDSQLDFLQQAFESELALDEVDAMSLAAETDDGFALGMDDTSALDGWSLDTDTSDGPPTLPAVELQTGASALDAATLVSNWSSDTPGLREVVFIDAAADEDLELMSDLLDQQAAGRDIEVFLLDPELDGIEQIRQVLAEFDHLDAVHLVTHGADGQIQLGNATLSNATWSEYAVQLAAWGDALQHDGDLLIYGCDVAATEDGRSLLELLRDVCDCDIAASDDRTGAVELGGDWDLEYNLGAIQSSVVFSADVQAEWGGVLATYLVTNTNDSGAGSLRDAIDQANASAGADVVTFNISGSGTQVISLASALPQITEQLTIDGTTQTGWVAGSFLPVVLDGNDVASGIEFSAAADGSLVRGLVIRDFNADAVDLLAGADNITIAGNWIGQFNSDGSDAGVGEANVFSGVRILGDNAAIGGSAVADRNVIAGTEFGVLLRGTATGNTVSGNYIGTDVAGGSLRGAIDYGVYMIENAAGNVIGGAVSADGNVIAGAAVDGIHLWGEGVDGNTIQNNYVGVSADGAVNLGNAGDGILIFEGGDNQQILNNLVASSGLVGIEVDGNGVTSSGNVIQGNMIGTDLTGVLDWGSGENGILLERSASDNVVGGVGAGDGNVVAFSGRNSSLDGSGIAVQDGSSATIRGNSVYSNRELGIDLSSGVDDGADANDAGDGDTGANGLQNFPVLTGAFTNASNTLAVTGTLNSTANSTFRIEFFANSGGGDEGQTWLGFRNVITDGSGNATFVDSFTASVAAGVSITATATNLSTGNTSEFSSVRATTAALVVDTTTDVLDGTTTSVANLLSNKGADGRISLREAIIATNNTAGADGILLAAGTYARSRNTAGEDLAASGDLDIRDALTIFGAGASTTTVLGNGSDRVFHVLNSATVSMTGITISSGTAVDGGGVFIAGGSTISFSDVVISNSTASGAGGGVANDGTIWMDQVRVTGNSASEGGGLENVGTAVITNSLVDANTSTQGGGLQSKDGTSNLTAINTTLSGNSVSGAGGGLALGNVSSLINVTISDNAANTGGGIYRVGGTTSIQNSIIADNSAGSGPDVSGAVSSGGYNIIGNASASSGWVGSDQQNVNPTLAPLADNGGPTLTHALYSGSPAENAGNPASTLAIDQRGTERDDGSIDVGAFEGAVAISRLTVDTTSDVIDGTTTSIQALLADKGADGRISLREAITATNNTANGPAPDEIHFNISTGDSGYVDPTPGSPGSGDEYWTIALTAVLPDITGRVIIDGTTQTGFTTHPVIELDGTSAGASSTGLHLVSTSAGSTIRGLAINRFGADGISAGGGGQTIVGNYLGTDVTGTIAMGNGQDGIQVSSNNNVIGGTTTADRNIIGGNASVGIRLANGSSSNIVQGNLVGVGAGGEQLGNLIGLTFGFTGAANNLVGGTAAGEGNVFAYNTNEGVGHSATAGNGNAVLGNSIHDNGELGLDIGYDGLTFNDSNDADTGANDLINFPVLTNVVQNGANLDISFVVDLPTGTYRIEFFDNPGGLDGSGFGEGQTFIGFATITATGAAGYESFSTTFNSVTVSDIQNVTVTATEDLGGGSYGSTSEFGPQFLGAGLIMVTTTSDTSDGDTSSIAALLGNRGADGHISLREAITATNNTANLGGIPDEIHFDITTALVSGTHTISLASALPTITEAVVINGTTDADFSGTPSIQIDGTSAGATADGLTLGAGSDGSTIRGLIINRFGHSGILVTGSGNNTLAGNYIGTDVTGTTGPGNGWSGITLSNGASGNSIGGTSIGDRNLVSGNTLNGIALSGAGTDGNLIIGNYVGVNAAGSGSVANGGNGIQISNSASGNIIGGDTTAERNILSGNTGYGLRIVSPGTDNNIVQGNYIGLNAAGDTAVSNGAFGLVVDLGAVGTQIGGVNAGEGNVISGNTGIDGSARRGGIYLYGSNTKIEGNIIGLDATASFAIANGEASGDVIAGIVVAGSGSGNVIGGTSAGAGNIISGNLGSGIAEGSSSTSAFAALGNSIYGNDAIGIDLSFDGVTTNDADDSDLGPNGLQNFPVLTNASSFGGNSYLSGTLTTNASTDYRIELFSSPTGDPTGYGEGQTYLGFISVTTDSGGLVAFDVTLTGITLTTGHSVTATATVDLGSDSFGHTSEFSQSVLATGDVAPTITSDGGGLTAAISITENTTAVTTVTSTDPDGGTPVYTIVGGSDQALFSIGSSSGVLTLTSARNREVATDFNVDHVYEVTVQVSDGNGGTTTQAISVTITDVDEFDITSPTDTDATANAIDENAINGTTVGITASATDDDATDSVSYSLDDDAAGRFAIDSVTGVVTVAGAIDREAAASYDIVV